MTTKQTISKLATKKQSKIKTFTIEKEESNFEKIENSFDRHQLHSLCDRLMEKDKELHSIFLKYGYPPFWSRKPNFETLIHIILEQQVSLSSAKAALEKLKKKIGPITAKRVILLSDKELRECYFSRQKTAYARSLAEAVLTKQIVFSKLNALSDDLVRERLTKIKGIGNWTVDVYLLMALHRTDIFPIGDLAMINSLKKVKRLPAENSQERILKLSEKWKPYRSIATMFLWHSYLEEKKEKVRMNSILPFRTILEQSLIF